MVRASRETTLMATAELWSKRGTCSRLQVGCVVEKEGRILVQGYNGAPAGMKHCSHSCKCFDAETAPCQPPEAHKTTCTMVHPCIEAVHAEANVIAFAARYGISLKEATLYSTHMPCRNCAMLIINSGIIKVMYNKPFRDYSGVALLREGFVQIDQYDMIKP